MQFVRMPRGIHQRMAQSIEITRALAVAALLLSLASPALAQDRRTTGATGTLPPAGVGQKGIPEWSGESGSSGHPLMMADAIRSLAANFSSRPESPWPFAGRRGGSPAA